MSTNSYNENCTHCSGKESMECCDDTRNGYSEECLDCGHYANTYTGNRMNLKEVNELRENRGMPTLRKLKGEPFLKKADYEKGFNILNEYYDSIDDDEKEEVDKRLKECGL